MDNIFTLCAINIMSMQMKTKLYVAFVDLETTFDCVIRAKLRNLLSSYSFNRKLLWHNKVHIDLFLKDKTFSILM